MKYSKSSKLLYLYNVIFTRLRKLWYTYIIYYTKIDCLRQNKRQNPIHFHPFAGKGKKWGTKGRKSAKTIFSSLPFLKKVWTNQGKRVSCIHMKMQHISLSATPKKLLNEKGRLMMYKKILYQKNNIGWDFYLLSHLAFHSSDSGLEKERY